MSAIERNKYMETSDLHMLVIGNWFFFAWEQGLWEYGHIKEWSDEYGVHRELTSMETSWQPVTAWEII